MANPNFDKLSGMDVYRPKDVYAIVNQMISEMTGGKAQITAVDTSSFVAVGEMALSLGLESTLSALTNMIGRTFIAIRPYRGRFSSVERNSQEWGLIQRKISFFTSDFGPTSSWNTDLNPDQLKDGKSVDMYTINKQYPMQMYFNGFTTLQKDVTVFRNQLKTAFQNESEFSQFFYGLSVEVQNDIEMMREAENRATVLNHIGAIRNVGSDAMNVNLTKEFNAARVTNYTTNELLTTHLQEFLSFMVSRIKTDSDLMVCNSELYHLTPKAVDDSGKALHLLRHTPKSKQKLLLYQPLINDATSWVYPAIFGPGYLSFGSYEGVNYWQNIRNKSAINVTPKQFDVNTGRAVTGEGVALGYVVGLLYDTDALGTTYMQESVDVAPYNTRGKYWNTTYNWVKRFQNDLTENAILYYMSDEP